MKSKKELKETRLEKICSNLRRGSYIIIKARTDAHYQSIVAVFTNKRYWNEEIVKVAEQLNKLSDEDFAVELVRAKKKVKNYLAAKTN